MKKSTFELALRRKSYFQCALGRNTVFLGELSDRFREKFIF